MKIVLLMVLFSTPADPEPHMAEGYAPRPAATLEQCLTRRAHLQAYMEANLPRGVRFKAFCTVTRIEGYDEALDAFRRALGAPL